MANLNPIIVLIPGAWHTPECFQTLRTHLSNHSFTTFCEKLPSISTSEPSAHTAQTDASFIRNELLLPLLNEGKRIVIVMHSYGGQPGSAAAYGLSEEERAKEGLEGGVVGLIYMAAFVVPSGQTCVEMEPPPLEGRSVDEKTRQILFHNPLAFEIGCDSSLGIYGPT